jgi:signal transduction histidine kinase/DNA-binding response OmpR family regulator
MVPLAMPVADRAGASNGSTSPGAEQSVILVVDDTEGNRFAIARWLEGAGFRVVQAASGTDALERAAGDAGTADLVVLDVVLPDIHGFEVARRLKADTRTAHVPVLHLSAVRVATADRVEGLETGADAYLTHPVAPEELIAIVRSLLRLSRTERRLREQNAALAAATQEAQRARAEAERAMARIARLQAATATLARVTSPAEIAAAVLAEAIPAVGAAGGAVHLADAERGDVSPLGASGAEFPAAVHAAAAVRARRAIWPAERANGDAPEPVAVAALPLLVGGDPAGALCLGFAPPRALDADERALLTAFAEQCAQALERARLRAAERAAEAERDRLYDLEQRARAAAESAYREAARANRAKGDFLAVMSHELRTPLNAIGGYAELMELGIRGPVTDEQRADLARLRAAQRYLLGLVTDVLNFVRVDSGRVEYELADVAVVEAVRALEGLIAPQFQARGVVYEAAPCDPSVRVRADSDRLQQILVNLLANALKFTEGGGRVTLTCEAGAETVALRVADTGVGIAVEQQAAVFEPFVQLKTVSARGGQEGVGLGLAISRDLARGMGGDLTVESAPGAGSTFTLTLPRG